MIVVRNSFSVDPTRMKEAITMAKDGRDIVKRLGFPVPRLGVDLAAEFYTLVLETEFASLADFESRLPQNFASTEWQQWYTRFTALVRGGRREIFRIVE
ncbi:MAG TPA: hypothetical protein VIP11_19950 [Gemmatimonadaceae bacterium]